MSERLADIIGPAPVDYEQAARRVRGFLDTVDADMPGADRALILTSLAHILVNQEDFAAAAREFERAIAVFEETRCWDLDTASFVTSRLAEMYSRIGETALALSEIARSLKLARSGAKQKRCHLMICGALLRRLGDIEACVEVLREWTEEEEVQLGGDEYLPEMAWLNLAEALHELRDYDGAVSAYARGIELARVRWENPSADVAAIARKRESALAGEPLESPGPPDAGQGSGGAP
jgi:tetratricopeptide (TPR) repeat protein